MIRFLPLIVAVALVTGCANPSIERVKADALAKANISTIFVPRFEGNPNFVEESTDFFVTALEARVKVRVIQGGPLRNESDDIRSGSNLVPLEVALAAGRARGADAVIVGKVTSYSNGMTLNGFSTVRLISAKDGEVLATFHRPSGLLFGYSEHQGVMAAVNRTAEDIAKVLLEAARH